MSTRLKVGGQESFLNSLLVMREQEVLNLSKKLHRHVPLDSDGGSGVSEGSLESPDLQALSSPHPPPRTSPEIRLQVQAPDQSQYLAGPSSSYVDDLEQRQRLQDLRLREEQQQQRHYDDRRASPEGYDVLRHDRSFGRWREEEDYDRWGHRSHQRKEEELQQNVNREEEDQEVFGEMNVRFQSQHQQQHQIALAARAFLGSLAPAPPTPSLLQFPVIEPEVSGNSSVLVRALASSAPRRPRGEKKPIPDGLKDEKYFERRKRNNLAAKKSRDARKLREDQIAIRASYLEKENAVLRAQVATLRDEASSLRHLLLEKKKFH